MHSVLHTNFPLNLHYRYFKRSKNRELIKEYVKSITIGDWFVLYQMSKNLNRRFFYDFLIQLANDASTEETDKVPLVTIEEGSKGDHALSGSNCNCNCNDIKKSTQSLVPPELDGGPPPLMQGSPDTLRKNPTDYSTKLFNAEIRRLSIKNSETKED